MNEKRGTERDPASRRGSDDLKGDRTPRPLPGADPEVADELGLDRKEVDGGEGSRRHPPHVTANDEGAEIQDDITSPSDVPVLPANAAGTDKLTSDEQSQPIDETSMYSRRPERDKNRPPSERVTGESTDD